jgi:uncharacterized membrane protein YphA (DoxX/SURF4 family)/thiol-disulfide isomerase/thioredoxin
VDLALLILRLLLAVVFATAAVGKLMDLGGSRRAMEDFGLPRRLAAIGGTLLPFLELGIAAALVVTPAARAGAVVALVLLLGFVAGIARLMRRGAAPDCHCFGQLHSEPVGRETLVRNVVLAAMSAVVAAGGAGQSLAGVSGEDVALLAMTGLACGLGLVALDFWRENRDLRQAPAARRAAANRGLPRGARVPDVTLRSIDGDAVKMGSLVGGGVPTALLQVSPTCGPCKTFLPEVVRWRERLAGQLEIITVSSAKLEDSRELAEELGISDMLVAENGEMRESFRVSPTPSAVLIDGEGRIAAAPAAGAVAIEELIRVGLRRAADGPLEISLVGR